MATSRAKHVKEYYSINMKSHDAYKRDSSDLKCNSFLKYSRNALFKWIEMQGNKKIAC